MSGDRDRQRGAGQAGRYTEREREREREREGWRDSWVVWYCIWVCVVIVGRLRVEQAYLSTFPLLQLML